MIHEHMFDHKHMRQFFLMFSTRSGAVSVRLVGSLNRWGSARGHPATEAANDDCVREIMTPRPEWVDAGDTVAEAARKDDRRDLRLTPGVQRWPPPAASSPIATS